MNSIKQISTSIGSRIEHLRTSIPNKVPPFRENRAAYFSALVFLGIVCIVVIIALVTYRKEE